MSLSIVQIKRNRHFSISPEIVFEEDGLVLRSRDRHGCITFSSFLEGRKCSSLKCGRANMLRDMDASTTWPLFASFLISGE